jgi:hypothetical protein
MTHRGLEVERSQRAMIATLHLIFKHQHRFTFVLNVIPFISFAPHAQGSATIISASCFFSLYIPPFEFAHGTSPATSRLT